jgi:fermentation-respiration switch protein FrsA (DUF1100 family)
VPSDRLLFYGESLGAAVVVELATEHRPAGLVLRSPFVDLASVGQVHYPFLPVKLLLQDRFPLADQLAAVNAPVTVVYGTGDTIVPAEQSRAVADAAPNLRACWESLKWRLTVATAAGLGWVQGVWSSVRSSPI